MLNINLFILLLISIICCLKIVTSQEKTGCTLPLPRLSFFAPLIFNENGELKSTDLNKHHEHIIKLETDEKIILSCAPNYLKKFPTLQFIEGTCKSDQTLIILNEERKYRKSLECEMRAIEEILIPVDGCNKTSVKFGFTHPITNQSYVIGESCYDEQLGKTIFVHLRINQIGQMNLNDITINIENIDYFKQEHPLSKLKLDFLSASQMDTLNERFNELFELNEKPKLIQFPFIMTKFFYSYQFYNVQKLGWNYAMLCEHVPRVMSKLLSTWRRRQISAIPDVYIGTHGILRRTNKLGVPIDVYLMDNKFPIAKYVWMLFKLNDKVIVFIIPNEGTEKSNLVIDLCRNRCLAGPVHCCQYDDEFRNKVHEMPQLNGTFGFLDN